MDEQSREGFLFRRNVGKVRSQNLVKFFTLNHFPYLLLKMNVLN